MKFKLLVFILVGLLLLVPAISPMIVAESLGTFEMDEDITLVQTCNNCTYCNLTSIKYPNSSIILSSVVMGKSTTEFFYNLSGGNTSVAGTYKYCYDCGNNVDRLTGCIDFEITVNGKEKPSGIVIVVFSLIFLIIIAVLISLIFYNIGKIVEEEYTLYDAIYNYSAYFILVATYILSKEYLANKFVNDFMLWVVSICGLTNVFFSTILLVLSLTIWKWRELEKW